MDPETDPAGRLADLREQAAQRAREMPWTDDTPGRAAEIAEQTAGFREMQIRTEAWAGDEPEERVEVFMSGEEFMAALVANAKLPASTSSTDQR
jgi:hypothetical protein